MADSITGSRTPAKALLDLPPELVSHILDYLEFESLKNLRLTASQVSIIVTPILFREVGVIFTKKSFNNLKAISLHPVLRLLVIELHYEGDRFYNISAYDDPNFDEEDANYASTSDLTYRAWKSLASQESSAWAKYDDSELRDENFEAYRALYDEQSLITRTRLDQQQISRAISRLPNLERVYVSMRQGGDDASALQKRYFEPARVLPDGDTYMKSYQPVGIRQAMSVMNALFQGPRALGSSSAVGKPLTTPPKFALRELHLHYIDIHLLSGLQRWTATQLSQLMGSLTEFRFYLIFNKGRYRKEELERRWTGLLAKPTIRNMVTAAPNLKYLCVHLGQCPARIRPRLLHAIAGDREDQSQQNHRKEKMTWPRLRRLHFTDLAMQLNDLTEFLNRHQNLPLHRVAFNNVVLEPEGWTSESNSLTHPSSHNIWADFATQIRQLNLSLDELEFRFGMWTVPFNSAPVPLIRRLPRAPSPEPIPITTIFTADTTTSTIDTPGADFITAPTSPILEIPIPQPDWSLLVDHTGWLTDVEAQPESDLGDLVTTTAPPTAAFSNPPPQTALLPNQSSTNSPSNNSLHDLFQPSDPPLTPIHPIEWVPFPNPQSNAGADADAVPNPVPTVFFPQTLNDQNLDSITDSDSDDAIMIEQLLDDTTAVEPVSSPPAGPAPTFYAAPCDTKRVMAYMLSRPLTSASIPSTTTTAAAAVFPTTSAAGEENGTGKSSMTATATAIATTMTTSGASETQRGSGQVTNEAEMVDVNVNVNVNVNINPFDLSPTVLWDAEERWWVGVWPEERGR